MVCPCNTIYKSYNSTWVDHKNNYIDVVYADCGINPSLKQFLKQINVPVRNIYAYTKCKKHDHHVFLKNRGRVDETYLYHIVKNYDKLSGLTLFIKNTFYRDSKDLLLGNPTKYISDLLNANVSFGCLMSYPIWHSCKDLFRFKLYSYKKKYDRSIKKKLFKSKYKSLGKWASYTSSYNFKKWKIKINCPVCYGGSFVAHSRNIKKIPKLTWEKIHRSLLRGDNIEESHFMERYWAMLLSNPLGHSVDTELECATKKSIIPPKWITGIKSNCTCNMC